MAEKGGRIKKERERNDRVILDRKSDNDHFANRGFDGPLLFTINSSVKSLEMNDFRCLCGDAKSNSKALLN